MRRCVLWGRARERRAHDEGQRGAAAVEFALILPILMILIFGIISYGMMLSFRQAISQAAAEGARAAAVAQRDADQVPNARAAVNEALEGYGVTCSGSSLTRDGVTVGSCAVTIATCDGEPATVKCASVRITYDYADHPLLGVPMMGMVLPDELEYTAVARVS
ncbi:MULTISPECIES: TadE/TadG family type IV pilus assembly protein [unclassified Nocardioides]|uniref:TadE/TadG family type IV pilus assembly protein n=1 Tax=unclassified Nocardioides TaxID=2615069 RepID=UPI0009E8182F|nr:MULTISPECIES: TadE/TadG family type IV pilus assembly protein [unclassified Nocardioides]